MLFGEAWNLPQLCSHLSGVKSLLFMSRLEIYLLLSAFLGECLSASHLTSPKLHKEKMPPLIIGGGGCKIIGKCFQKSDYSENLEWPWPGRPSRAAGGKGAFQKEL